MSHARSESVLIGLPAQTTTTNGNGSAIDLRTYAAPGFREIKAHLNCGTITGTEGTLVVSVEESTTTGSGWAAVASGTTAFSQLSTTTGGETIYFKAAKRYVRFVKTVGGTSPSFVVGVALVVPNRVS